jgi:hypothetical protein
MAVALTRPRVELFCFGAPVALRDRFQKMVGVAICDDLLQDPYALLEIVLEEMYKVLDLSGWTVSTIFGDMERVSGFDFLFSNLSDGALGRPGHGLNPRQSK